MKHHTDSGQSGRRLGRGRLVIVAVLVLLAAAVVHRFRSGRARTPDARANESETLYVLCPADGIVGRLLINEGDLVTNRQALARIHSAVQEQAVIAARTDLSEARLELRYAALLLESLRTSSARGEQLRRMQLSALHEQQREQLKQLRERAVTVAAQIGALQAAIDRSRLDPFVTPADYDETRERDLGRLRSQYNILQTDIARREALLAGFAPTQAAASPIDHRLADVEKSVRIAEETVREREATWRAAVSRRDNDAMIVRAAAAGQVLRLACREGDALRLAAPVLVMQKLSGDDLRRFLAPQADLHK